MPFIKKNKNQLDPSISKLLNFYADGDPYEALKSGGVMAKAWARNLVPDTHSIMVDSFIFSLLNAYWQEIQKNHIKGNLLEIAPAPSEVKELDYAVETLAKALGLAISKIDIIEANQYLGNLYASIIPVARRSKDGIFYTPSALVKRLIELSENAGIKFKSSTMLDPACGCGAFLLELFQRVRNANSDLSGNELVAQLQTQVKGFEKDAFAGWITHVFLEAELIDIITNGANRLGEIVSVGDSLEIVLNEPLLRFDLIIGNPPYGKIKLEPPIRERFKESLFGHANLYGIFTHLSLDLATENGVVALLTPTSYLSGEYFKNLRSYIMQMASPIEMDFVSFRKGVFEDVLQETMLTVFKIGHGHDNYISINQITTSTLQELQVEAIGRFSVPQDSSLPWILPKTVSQSSFVRCMTNFSKRLKDWGYGVSTGQLVWNRHKDQLGLEMNSGSLPVIWAESITREGDFFWKSEKKNHSPFFSPSGKEGFLETKKSCVLLQRTTAKEQHKRLIAAVLPQQFIDTHGSVVIENHVNMLIPIVDKPLVSPEMLSAFLNSFAANEAFRSMSGSVAVSAYELESFPLPDSSKLKALKSALVKNDQFGIQQCCKRLYLIKNND